MSNEPLYRPLHGLRPLRLIRLQPGVENETLALRLFPADIAYCVDASIVDSYEALSYTWGEGAATENVLCNGQPFALRANAARFLQRLRRPHESHILWMDCICINQDDIAERSAQVKFMHEIYANAKAVLIWLGDEHDDSDLAMDYISKLNARALITEFIVSQNNNIRKSFIFDGMKPTEENKRLIRALCNLLERPWVRRIWIQQEAAMSPNTTVICGSKEVHWDNFFAMTWLLTQRTSSEWPEEFILFDQTSIDADVVAIATIQLNRHRILDIRPLVYIGTERPFEGARVLQGSTAYSPSLGKLLSDCASCKATDPRDKVYAVFNVLSHTLASKKGVPKVDYSRPWQALFIDTARHLYEAGEIRTISSAGRSRQMDAAGLPSWVPDWRHSPDISFVAHPEWFAGGCAWLPQLKFLNVSKQEAERCSLPRYFHIDTKGRRKRAANSVMQLDCIMMDRVLYVSPTSKWPHRFVYAKILELKDIIESTLAHTKQHMSTHASGEPVQSALAATLIANTTHNDTLAIEEYLAGFNETRAWLYDREDGLGPPYLQALDNFEVFRKSSFCITAHGLMCRVPNLTSVGDYIGILSGFHKPAALHRTSSPPDKYFELLGDCYVHGMMQSRAWDMILEFNCKYQEGSEDRSSSSSAASDDETSRGEDFSNIREILGRRKITLV